MTDGLPEREAAAKALRDSVRVAALDILYRRRNGVHSLKDVRNLILSDSRSAALALLIEEYEFEQAEADTVLEFLDPAIKGKQLRFEEISPSDILFSDPEDATEEEDADPLEVRIRYFARRGLTVAEAFPTTSIVSGQGTYERTDKIFFDSERLDPSDLQQAWRVVAVDG